MEGSAFKLRPAHATAGKRSCVTLRRPNAKTEKTIVVLGIERGGTSMVAGVLRALGINMGERAGLNHEDPKFMTDDTEQLAKRIADRNAEHTVWGFKMPKAALNLDFYQAQLRNPHYVIVFRNFAAVMDSWDQRGAGSPLDVLDRAVTYFSRITESVRVSGAPALAVNYERAVGDSDLFIEELAEFLDLRLTPDLRARAAAIITGDGSGYVNLPEHHFLVQSKPRLSEGCLDSSEFVCRHNLGDVADASGTVHYKNHQRKVVFTPDKRDALPESFWVVFDLEGDRSEIETSKFRTYFDFTGAFFPGHATRPVLTPGRNVLHVETNGKAARMAFGPVNPPSTFRLTNVHFYEAPDDEQPAHAEPARRDRSRVRRALGQVRRFIKGQR
jgi:hypothetical protein